MLANRSTVLLVEDNPADCRLFSEALKFARWQVDLRIVTDGAIALQYLFKRGAYVDSKAPDLIVLDLNMPRMNGITLLETIKSTPELREIPAVVLTTSQSLEDRAAVSAADLFLIKPLDLDDYFATIRDSLACWLGDD